MSAIHSDHPDEAGDSASLSELPTREALAAHASPIARSPTLPSQKYSPIISAVERPQLQRSSSRVDVDFFDPDGVRKLNRTLSHMSRGTSGRDDVLSASITSDDTMIAEGPFDFEKMLRVMMKR